MGSIEAGRYAEDPDVIDEGTLFTALASSSFLELQFRFWYDGPAPDCPSSGGVEAAAGVGAGLLQHLPDR